MVWLMISARDGRTGISSYFNMACFCYLVPDKLSACRIVFLEASSITFNFVISFFFYVSEECSAPPLHWTSFSTRVCPLEQLGQEWDCLISEVTGRIFCLCEERPNVLWCSAFSAALSSFCLSLALSLWIKRSSWWMLNNIVGNPGCRIKTIC